jgi:hypothetical protein
VNRACQTNPHRILYPGHSVAPNSSQVGQGMRDPGVAFHTFARAAHLTSMDG